MKLSSTCPSFHKPLKTLQTTQYYTQMVENLMESNFSKEVFSFSSLFLFLSFSLTAISLSFWFLPIFPADMWRRRWDKCVKIIYFKPFMPKLPNYPYFPFYHTFAMPFVHLFDQMIFDSFGWTFPALSTEISSFILPKFPLINYLAFIWSFYTIFHHFNG